MINYSIESQTYNVYPAVIVNVNGENIRHDNNKRISTAILMRAGMCIQQAARVAFEVDEAFDDVRQSLKQECL